MDGYGLSGDVWTDVRTMGCDLGQAEGLQGMDGQMGRVGWVGRWEGLGGGYRHIGYE